MRLERDSFELSELAERWGISGADIRYLVANARMRLSVRILAQPALVSGQELTAEGEPVWVPVEEKVYTGLADLPLRDAFRLVRHGEGQVRNFFLPGDIMVTLRDDAGISVSDVDLLVRRRHAEALERELIGVSAERKESFDFRLFVFDGQEFAFTVPQARALEFMLEQTRAGAPEQHHVDILRAVGSASQRLSSLFSRKPYWTRLLRQTAGRRGWYHLDPGFVVWLIASG
jgi:hypothetical protein